MKTAALVGHGRWGKNIARNLSELGVLHTVCDAELTMPLSPYNTVCTTHDFQTVLTNPAIKQIFIATPPHTHYDLAKQALLVGKDVFVEKPLCLDVSEGEELLKMANELGRILMVGHLLHYHPCVEKIKEVVTQGALGEIRTISSHRLFPGLIREENVLWDLLPHDISVILSLCQGLYPERISTQGTALDETMDTITVSLQFPSNIQAHIVASWVYPFKEQKLVIIGTEGSLVFDDTKEWGEKLSLKRRKQELFPKIEYETINCPVEKQEPLKMECLHFLKCCESRTDPVTNGPEALNCLKLLREIEVSSNQSALLKGY